MSSFPPIFVVIISFVLIFLAPMGIPNQGRLSELLVRNLVSSSLLTGCVWVTSTWMHLPLALTIWSGFFFITLFWAFHWYQHRSTIINLLDEALETISSFTGSSLKKRNFFVSLERTIETASLRCRSMIDRS